MVYKTIALIDIYKPYIYLVKAAGYVSEINC